MYQSFTKFSIKLPILYFAFRVLIGPFLTSAVVYEV